MGEGCGMGVRALWWQLGEGCGMGEGWGRGMGVRLGWPLGEGEGPGCGMDLGCGELVVEVRMKHLNFADYRDYPFFA